MVKGRRVMKFWFSLLIGLWLIHPPEVFAYIDPGTGSFILQMLIAGAMGLLFAAKAYWQKITSFVRQVFQKIRKNNAARKGAFLSYFRWYTVLAWRYLLS